MKAPLDPLDKIRSPEPAVERRGRSVGKIEGAYDRDHWARRKAQVVERLPLIEAIGRVVKLQKAGTPNEHKGLCPFHNEKTPSFTVNTKKGLFHCFGCGANGRNVIDFAMQVQGLDFKQAIESLESANGLRYLETARPVPKPVVPQVEEVKRDQAIQRIWAQAVHDPAVDQYLRGRSLVPCAEYGFGDPAVNGGWPADLRFHPRLWHGIERRELPAMVAPFRKGGEIVALHRTYLKRVSGGWVKAGTKNDKMHLGPRGGALILLSEPSEAMTAGEGIETSLSNMQLWRRAGFAYGSADAMAAVEPPFVCVDLLIGADWNAKNRTGEVAAWKAKKAFERGGRRISVKVPNLRDQDKADFNDVLVLKARGEAVQGSADAPPVAKTKAASERRSAKVVAKARPPTAAERAAAPEELKRQVRDLHRNERAAWLKYSAAEEALAACPSDAAAQREVEGTKRAWSAASHAYERAAERTLA